MKYRPLIVDSQLKLRMEAFGAVQIVGPKGCGKTTTAKQKARTVIEANAKMAIQRAITSGKLELSISFLSFSEVKRCPNVMAKEYNLNFMKSYYKVYVGRKEKESLKPLIEEIVSKGIKTADATHIACAIKSGCDYLITTDDRSSNSKTLE